MRVLFLHNNFPAQYRHVARKLGEEKENQVIFASHRAAEKIPGVVNVLYKPHREGSEKTHHYLRSTESAVINGQSLFKLCIDLKKKGFSPDIICAHSGWGPALYVKEVFPHARLLCYFEWYYHAFGSDADFLQDSNIGYDDAGRIRTKNMPLLMDLAHCDWGQVPTQFQAAQIPKVFHSKLSVLHDGVDTDFFKPDPDAPKKFGALDLSHADEILTYATRGMEPYRGFPEFMRAAALLLKERPNLHVVVVGQDRVAYGKKRPDGKGWGEAMVEELKPDRDRLHFTGLLPYADYVKVLQASTVQAYLTVPFVLSWSLIESLSSGALVVASDTAPVREVIRDGENGFLSDFFDHEALARRIAFVLDNHKDLQSVREAARNTVLETYSHQKLLPRQLQLIRDVAAGTLPPTEGSME
ncbi:glycosyltransferase family 4 protein [Sneathiella chinensis]|uniref:Glycosyl transferase family 1 n=1 Tax=Sneathiella chinensis TaxID=349750 RepID=A0ABQ5TZ82_9PROT|nr:glycosyltransferase family 4 protein [Sneathiella chinensis]GLQ04919.1 glycosyl transferase family 1 [Sneathiella chinensis]